MVINCADLLLLLSVLWQIATIALEATHVFIWGNKCMWSKYWGECVLCVFPEVYAYAHTHPSHSLQVVGAVRCYSWWKMESQPRQKVQQTLVRITVFASDYSQSVGLYSVTLISMSEALLDFTFPCQPKNCRIIKWQKEREFQLEGPKCYLWKGYQLQSSCLHLYLYFDNKSVTHLFNNHEKS